MVKNTVEIHKTRTEPWKVTILYTGENAMTGSRIKKAQKYIGNERFLLTYGDGVANVNISELIKCHEKSGKILTLTAVQLEGRYGALGISEDNTVTGFREKPKGDECRINGGYFVCESQVFGYIPENDDNVTFEEMPIENITKDNQLNAYKHNGFWRSMDTLRDKIDLTRMWQSQNAPWVVW